MSNQTSSGQMANQLKSPQRNNYFFGKLMDVLHFDMETQYFNHQRRLLNRLSLGTGVLCGLDVISDKDKNRICVMPGVAIDAMGREIIVPMALSIDPWKLINECGQVEKELPRDEANTVHICLDYNECATDFMPVLVTDCNTSEQCAPSTLVESFRLLVREGNPEIPPRGLPADLCQSLIGKSSNQGTNSEESDDNDSKDDEENNQEAEPDNTEQTFMDRYQLLCKSLSVVCPEIPKQSCVPLAVVQLLEDGTVGKIDTCSVRPTIYSNAQLLDLILCLAERIEDCCDKKPQAPQKQEITAAFTADPSQGDAPLAVQLSNQSTGEIDSYTWDFGNGTTSSDKAPDTQVFTAAGDYTISLTVSGAGGQSTATQTIQVTKTTLKVTAVEFLDTEDEIIVQLQSPPNIAPQFSPEQKLAAFKVYFNKAVRSETIFDNPTSDNVVKSDTFVIEKDGDEISGLFTFSEEQKAITFRLSSEPEVFTGRDYRVTLYGTSNDAGNYITDLNNEALDGEPLGLPSGDDVEGGNFEFIFIMID